MAPVRGPIVPRRRLGAELRRLRERSGLLIEQAARELECSTSKISRLETGKGVPRIRDVRDLLNVYRVDDQKLRDRLLRWARDGQQQGWWEKYADLLRPGKLRQDHLDTLYALEADASVIRTYQTTVIPGLLQTSDYARHLLIALMGSRLDLTEIDRLVELRMQRQQVLTRQPDPLRMHCVLDEAVLLRPVGGPRVMREQVRHLLDMVNAGNTIQVLPLSVGAHPAMVGPFVILEFADSADQAVVYVESHAGGTYMEQPADVAFHQQLFRTCSEAALDQGRSLRLLDAADLS